MRTQNKLSILIGIALAITATSALAITDEDENSVHSWGPWRALVQPAAGGPRAPATTSTLASVVPGFGSGDAGQFTANVVVPEQGTPVTERKLRGPATLEATRIASIVSDELDLAKVETRKLSDAKASAREARNAAQRAATKSVATLEAAKLAAKKAAEAPKLADLAVLNLKNAIKTAAIAKQSLAKAQQNLAATISAKNKIVSALKNANQINKKIVADFKNKKSLATAALRVLKKAIKASGTSKDELIKLTLIADKAQAAASDAKARKQKTAAIVTDLQLKRSDAIKSVKLSKKNRDAAKTVFSGAKKSVTVAKKKNAAAKAAITKTARAAKKAKVASVKAAARAKTKHVAVAKALKQEAIAKRAAENYVALTDFPRKEVGMKTRKESCTAGQRCGYAVTALGDMKEEQKKVFAARIAAPSPSLDDLSVVNLNGDVVKLQTSSLDGKKIVINVIFDAADSPSFAYGTGNVNPNSENINFATGTVTAADYIESVHAGNVVATYNGFTLGSGSAVAIDVDFGKNSWRGIWNNGSDSNGKIGFIADGGIKGSNIISSSIRTRDRVAGIRGSVTASFFGNKAAVLSGVSDVTKEYAKNNIVHDRDIFVAVDQTKVQGLPVVTTVK